jgi:hypothetical protein
LRCFRDVVVRAVVLTDLVVLAVVRLAVVVVVAVLVDVVLTVVLLEGLAVVVVFDVVDLTVVLAVVVGVLLVVVAAVGFLVVWASCFVHHQIILRHIVKKGDVEQIETQTRNAKTTHHGDNQADGNQKEENRKELHFLSRRSDVGVYKFKRPCGSSFYSRAAFFYVDNLSSAS